jgi:hypothetical protein
MSRIDEYNEHVSRMVPELIVKNCKRQLSYKQPDIALAVRIKMQFHSGNNRLVT